MIVVLIGSLNQPHLNVLSYLQNPPDACAVSIHLSGKGPASVHAAIPAGKKRWWRIHTREAGDFAHPPPTRGNDLLNKGFQTTKTAEQTKNTTLP